MLKSLLKKGLLTICCIAGAACFVAAQQLSYPLVIQSSGKDSGFSKVLPQLQNKFAEEALRSQYVSGLVPLLQSRGYVAASVDSVWNRGDTTFLLLYAGPQYHWLHLNTAGILPNEMHAAGFMEKDFSHRPVNFSKLQALQQRLLGHYENTGYPFASVFLDSIRLLQDSMYAVLHVNKGPLYHIDSIRVTGSLKINKGFLQRYLQIKNGSIYSKTKLAAVDKKIMELPFVSQVQSSDLSMLGSGSVLNLYADTKKASQVNVLVGFLPAQGNQKKMQLTGDVHLDLKNLLAGAEEILVKWQQLQPKSPRLNLGFTKPYIFSSAFGVQFLFDLFKKDSNFLQLNAHAGLLFDVGTRQKGKLFLQWQNSRLLSGGVDTNAVIASKQLPVNIDMRTVSMGMQYNGETTDYKLNPRRGSEWNFTGAVGIKNIKPNNDIVNIKDPGFNYASLYDSLKPKSYQLKLTGGLARYFALGKRATVKAALQGGFYQSPAIFRNELFQIGGYKLLRGFSEESIYATRYAVFTAEYRYLIGLNSYLFSFADLGFVKNKYRQVDVSNQFTGWGVGILFETKAGLLNLSYALGKRNDVPFNIREASKLHIGYINYF